MAIASIKNVKIAGMAACLWQALPNLTAMELRDLIMQSSSLYPLHEDQRGYGIPDAWLAYSGVQSALPKDCSPKPGEGTDGQRCVIIQNNHVSIVRDGTKYTVLGVRME